MFKQNLSFKENFNLGRIPNARCLKNCIAVLGRCFCVLCCCRPKLAVGCRIGDLEEMARHVGSKLGRYKSVWLLVVSHACFFLEGEFWMFCWIDVGLIWWWPRSSKDCFHNNITGAIVSGRSQLVVLFVWELLLFWYRLIVQMIFVESGSSLKTAVSMMLLICRLHIDLISKHRNRVFTGPATRE